jgi:hypothetical protein
VSRRWWTARQIATAIGVLAVVVGVVAIVVVSSDASIAIGVALIAVGLYVVGRSAWLARRRPDDTPWNPLLDGDLTGGL